MLLYIKSTQEGFEPPWGFYTAVGFQDRCLDQFEPLRHKEQMAWQEGFEPPAPLSRKHQFSELTLLPTQALPQKMALGPGLEPGWVLRRRRISSAVPYHFRTAKQNGGTGGTRTPMGLVVAVRVQTGCLDQFDHGAKMARSEGFEPPCGF